ncbi:HAD family hydrolase [Fluviispira multicolorata]|uniref:HAD-IB family hydrolase n=1 Tax=Fluviispira multicolorata TaxID=2654512 RepID=A0A833N3T7_9BACT|nr:HAD-IB family hydrolase [Fluviispira multicolorata]KAB8030724.1 HAD-IB family hydrolase [Fluviispira multicolorata]
MYRKNNSITKRVNYYAFFDVDETIIQEKSMFSFLYFYSKKMVLKLNIIKVIKIFYYFNLIKYLKINKYSRDHINEIYYKFYKGININTLNNHANEWFDKARRRRNFFNSNIINEIYFHKMNGAKVVLVSGSFQACLKPIANYLGIEEILCTQMEILDQKCTGNLLNIPIIGEGKVILIKQLLLKDNFSNYSLCYAYGDHISDLPMLNFVGNPRVVPNCKKLLEYAKEKNWVLL